ncbi:MAG: CRISPR-associated endonuclease Cas2 [Fimbriimonadia bacterium]
MRRTHDILVSYDVDTTSAAGRRRLRRVAKVCTAFGQRVQYSVFECCVSDMDLEKLRRKLLDVLESAEDSLRIYRLRQPREEHLEVYGRDRWIDFEGPLVV